MYSIDKIIWFKDFPEKCWDPSTEKAYNVEEVFYLENKCTRGICTEGFTIQYHT